MLDDLRNSSSFIEEEEPENPEEQGTMYRSTARRRRKEPFMGMTAQQRFILSLMLFFMVFILGLFALVVSGAVILPF
jgi:hypothetical protein